MLLTRGQGVCWQVWGILGGVLFLLNEKGILQGCKTFYFILLHNFCPSIYLFCLLIRWFWQWLRTLSMANDQAEGRGVVSCCQEHTLLSQTLCEQKSTIRSHPWSLKEKKKGKAPCFPNFNVDTTSVTMISAMLVSSQGSYSGFILVEALSFNFKIITHSCVLKSNISQRNILFFGPSPCLWC